MVGVSFENPENATPAVGLSRSTGEQLGVVVAEDARVILGSGFV